MRSRRKGVVLVTFAVALVVILGGAGLAFDIGRMYIAKIEAQSYVDAAALAAVNQLDGQADALTRAEAAARQAYWKDWYFNTLPIDQGAVTVEFGTGADGPWGASALEASFARVRSSLQVPIYLARPLTAMENGTVASVAVAGKQLVTSLSEGLFPFFVVGRPNAAGGGGPSGGLVPGRQYAFGWAINAGERLKLALSGEYVNIRNPGGVYPFVNKTPQYFLLHPEDEQGAKAEWQWCEGDTDPSFLNYMDGLGAQTTPANDLFKSRGSWCSDGSKGCGTSVAADGIQYGYQTQEVYLNDTLLLPDGARQALENYIVERINLDDDQNMDTNSVLPYLGNEFDPDFDNMADNDGITGGTKTGVFTYSTPPPKRYRLIIAPILSPEAVGPDNQGTVMAFGAFLLLTDGDNTGKNNPFYGGPQSNWCATYAGATTLWGMGSAPGNTGGLYYVRLFR
jgi:hypothetical protein